jgi:hypothetical protein
MLRLALRPASLRLVARRNVSVFRFHVDPCVISVPFNNPRRYLSSTNESKEDKGVPPKAPESENPTDGKDDNAGAKSESEDVNKASTAGPSTTAAFGNFFSSINVSNIYSVVKDNVKLAWSEMIGETKESSLRKQVQQAASFRRAGEEKVSEAEEDEEEKYSGPTAIVVVKDRGSAWEQMKSRLSESPLIREMLKKTRVVSQAAAETDIGKKAAQAGENLKNKMEVRVALD